MYFQDFRTFLLYEISITSFCLFLLQFCKCFSKIYKKNKTLFGFFWKALGYNVPIKAQFKDLLHISNFCYISTYMVIIMNYKHRL